MPALLSHYRPDLPIYMFTDDEAVMRRLAMYHGVTPLCIKFGADADETFERCGAPAVLLLACLCTWSVAHAAGLCLCQACSVSRLLRSIGSSKGMTQACACAAWLAAGDTRCLGCPGTLSLSSACRAIEYLKQRNFVKGGQQVAIVQSGREPIWRSASTHAIQACLFTTVVATERLGLCLLTWLWQLLVSFETRTCSLHLHCDPAGAMLKEVLEQR